MDPNTFPTKGNLILAKNALALSKQGFDLMDKKRNILIRELMELISEASDIQNQIDETFSNAYQALQKANIQMGIHQVEQIAKAVPVENSIRIKRRSVMGTEIPKVECSRSVHSSITFYDKMLGSRLFFVGVRKQITVPFQGSNIGIIHSLCVKVFQDHKPGNFGPVTCLILFDEI